MGEEDGSGRRRRRRSRAHARGEDGSGERKRRRRRGESAGGGDDNASRGRRRSSGKRDQGSPSTSSGDDAPRDEGRHRGRDIQAQAQNIAKVLQETGRVVGYDDEENPFGDASLSQAFVWHKKIEKQLDKGVDDKVFSADAVREQHEKRLKEIEEVKQRRLERERELAQREEEIDAVQKERLLSEAAELEEKEEGFHVQQARTRSEIRLREGRAKPVDVLYDILNGVSGSRRNLHDPLEMLECLDMADLQELEQEIQAHVELDKDDGQKSKFWDSALTLCRHFLVESRRRSDDQAPQVGFHRSLDADMRELLQQKDVEDLERLKDDITGKLAKGIAGDEEYWEAILKRLVVEIAQACLSSHYSKQLQVTPCEDQARPSETVPLDHTGRAETGNTEQRDKTENLCDGRYSPEPEEFSDDDDEAGDIIDDAQDAAELQLKRAQVHLDERKKVQAATHAGLMSQKRPGPSHNSYAPRFSHTSGNHSQRNTFGGGSRVSEDEARLLALSNRLMGPEEDGEERFNIEVPVDKKVEWWHNKYQVRKPKYFNRVHTGFEWSKYNQTHYDYDNPPPKVVQGYKFNIFYPDLVEKSQTPVYKIEKDPESWDGSTCFIRFHAGPPYEDIAFKIVNKEWEYGHKTGFKCSFERGILHLHFNFKRQRYRK